MNTIAVQYHYDASKLDVLAAERPAHREFLGKLFEAGTLLASGPMGSNFALIILDAATPAEALQILEADPLFAAGVIEERRALPWNAVYGPWN